MREQPSERLGDFLSQSDFVVVTAPRTPETIGMLGEAKFRSMKPSAFYICFSRGGIADDTALLRALTEGWIAGAGLDAHGQEPLPPDSPFWTAPNTIITPHNGATTPFTRQRGVDNLKRYIAGQLLRNVVDKRAGTRGPNESRKAAASRQCGSSLDKEGLTGQVLSDTILEYHL